MIIEFVGLPGAGKTTHGDQLAAALRKNGYTTYTRRELERNPPGRIHKFFSYARLAAAHLPLVWIVARQAWQQRPSHRRAALSGFMHTLLQRSRLAGRLQAGEISVLDEGLVHRGAATVFGYGSADIDPFALRRYLNLIPLPDVLVHVDVAIDTCITRIGQRGRPERMSALSESDVALIFERTERAIEITAGHMVERGLSVISIRAADRPTAQTNLEDQIARLLDRTASPAAGDPPVAATKPLRVCMVTYTFPPVYAGSGTQALRLARHMRGVSVQVLTARHEQNLPGREQLDGVSVLRLRLFGKGALRALSFALGAAWHLLRRGGAYDIVHVHGAYWRSYPVIIAALARGKASLLKMTQMHTDDPQTIRQRRFGRILHGVLARADAIVSISAPLSAAYRASGLPAGRLVEIPNGVDTKLFCAGDGSERASIRSRLGIPDNALLAVFVGQVGYRKGADVLLDAWPSVVERYPDSYLALIGPTHPDAAEVEPLIEKTPQTIPTGQRTDVHEYLRAADVFVLPSRMEGLPNALMEAMSTSVASVASDIGANAELIVHGDNGLLFEPDNVAQLAEMIVRVFASDDERKQFGRHARETIIKRYSMEDVADRYVDLYRELLRRRGHRDDD